MTIYDKIYEEQGQEALEAFLDAVKLIPVEGGIEFHLECDLGHFQTTLDTTEPTTLRVFDEIYTTLYKFYSFGPETCPPME